MTGFLRNYKGFTRIGVIALTLITFASGCTNRSQTTSPVVLSEDGSDSTSDVSYDYSGDSSLYDSTSSTATSSNLFDTTTTADVPATASTTVTTTPAVTSSQQICLASNGNVLGSSNGSALPSTCYDTASTTTSLNQSMLFDLGVQSFGSMDYCFQMVMARGQQFCSATSTTLAATDLNLLFQSSQMALVRCFRGILQQQMAATNWAPEQDESYENNDALMFLLLKMFSNQ